MVGPGLVLETEILREGQSSMAKKVEIKLTMTQWVYLQNNFLSHIS